jgi:hypothetical protein
VLAGVYPGRKEMLDHLRMLGKSLGHPPRYSDIRKPQPEGLSSSRYGAVFGSYNKAVVEAGLSPRLQRWSGREDEMLDLLRSAAVTLGRPPSAHEMSSHGPSYQSFTKVFGSWNAAVFAAGLVPSSSGPVRVTGRDGTVYDSRLEHTVSVELLNCVQSGKILGFIPHQRVCPTRRWTCDFLVLLLGGSALWLEVDGLGDSRKNRDEHQEKLDYMRSSGFYVLVVTAQDYGRSLHTLFKGVA